jgi:HAD superfamily hydrolase (TIGR01484 family)
MPIQAIFFDIDGTLVSFQTQKMPESTRLALAKLKEKGIKTFICTGRPPVYAALLKDQLDFEFDGYVFLNGQYCTEKDGTCFYKKTLSKSGIEAILQWSQSHPEVYCLFMEPDYVYANRAVESDVEAILDDPGRCLTHETYQVSPWIDPSKEPELLSMTHEIKSVRWNPDFTDLIPADGGKSVGIQQLLEHFGLSQEKTMAFGDGGNDIEMLQYVHLGVAMGNGTQNVKDAADYVTDSVDEDGIWNALVHFGLIE